MSPGGALRGHGPLRGVVAAGLGLLGLAGAVGRGLAEERTYRPDLTNCAGFTAADAAPLLGVAADRIHRTVRKVHATLTMCAFAGGAAGRTVAFSIEVAPSPKAAAAAMERYRGDLEVAAGTAPFKDRLPKGAYSEILGEGLGDENVWTDVNGSLTLRKGNVTVQVTMPEDRLQKIRVGQAVLAKL